MRPSIWILPALAACTPRAITPPARTFVMDSPSLETGHQDAQIDVSRTATIFGPELVGGNGRFRHAISPTTIVEGEVGVLHVANDGSGGDRNAYTGRLGGIWRGEEDSPIAFTAGAGGGESAVAGAWGGVDAGVMVGGHHKYIRPAVSVDVGYSAPFTDRTFTVHSDGAYQLRLTPNAHLRCSAGLEIGTEAASLLVGASLIQFKQFESSVVGEDQPEDDLYLAAGIGMRFRVD